MSPCSGGWDPQLAAKEGGTRSGIAQSAANAIIATGHAAEAAKKTLAKGTEALVNQEAIRGTQYAKVKVETQEQLQALEKTIG